MFDPVALVATSSRQPATIIAVVVVFPFVPLTSATVRPLARLVNN
jgi:hypothetical protein